MASSSGWAHGIATSAPKVVYCHNPARWLYQTDSYLRSLPGPARRAFRLATQGLQRWDAAAALSAHTYLANSTVVAGRIRRAYGIESEILHPPVSLLADGPQEPVPGLQPGYFLTVARSRGYKNTDLVCQAVAGLPGRRLVCVGRLPEPPSSAGWPSEIVEVSDLSDAQLRWVYANCEAVVTMSEEDFGLTPVEGHIFGKPTVAVRAGGFLDTVLPGINGTYVEGFDADALRQVLTSFDGAAFDADLVRDTARRFGVAEFRRRLRDTAARAAGALSDATRREPVLP